MCTVSIKVDEDLIREVLPELEDTVAIRIWAQMLIDRHIEALIKEYAQQQLEKCGLSSAVRSYDGHNILVINLE